METQDPNPDTWTKEERERWACGECGGTRNPIVPPEKRHDLTCSKAKLFCGHKSFHGSKHCAEMVCSNYVMKHDHG